MHVAAILKLKGRNVVTTTADKSMLEIAKLLSAHAIGCVVVVGDGSKVTGIVSERDLMRRDWARRSRGLEEAGLRFHDKDHFHGAGG